MNAVAAALVGVAYLLGSVAFAVLLVRLTSGRDIRSEGSGNAGATNVLRAHGKALALAVAALDIGKGALAVWLVRLVTADPRYAAAAALARLRNALGGVKVIYWVRGYPPGLRNTLLRAQIRWRVGWFGFRNVSTVDHGDLDAFLRAFRHLGMYFSTINSPTRMATLRDAGARVILTDLDEITPGFQP